VELQSRVDAEEESEEAMPAGDRIAELEDIPVETEAQIEAEVEEGIAPEAGATQKEELEASLEVKEAEEA
jgi:hypothetical protein